jgi:hypothetical protein
VSQTPSEAKDESERRIFSCLVQEREGARFGELKSSTGLHQDTLSVRLKELRRRKLVRWVDKRYRISEEGAEDLDRLNLIELISSAQSYAIVGDSADASMYPDDDAILRSSRGFAFPGISPGTLAGIKKVVHKYWMLHLLATLSRNHEIDPRCFTGEKPLGLAIEQIQSRLISPKQVLVFTIDPSELRKHVTPDYLKEILRIGKIEDEHRIESRDSRFGRAFQEYTIEVRALEFLESKYEASLEEITNHLGIRSEEARGIMNGMLIDNRHLRTIMARRSPQNEGIKVRILKRKRYLRRWEKNGRTYYTLERSPKLPGKHNDST